MLLCHLAHYPIPKMVLLDAEKRANGKSKFLEMTGDFPLARERSPLHNKYALSMLDLWNSFAKTPTFISLTFQPKGSFQDRPKFFYVRVWNKKEKKIFDNRVKDFSFSRAVGLLRQLLDYVYTFAAIRLWDRNGKIY